MATQPGIPRSFGEADPQFLTQPAPRPKEKLDPRAQPSDAPSVDAHTAELRERIAATSRIAVIGSLLLRR